MRFVAEELSRFVAKSNDFGEKGSVLNGFRFEALIRTFTSERVDGLFDDGRVIGSLEGHLVFLDAVFSNFLVAGKNVLGDSFEFL